ncbi:hypothetical protein KIN20_023198 [Parelaphostrongylus tenuis]|uniref:Uncharacterized protein n=1 Tax=Parelaphostrongylus tenuis TaxID=148309 RepID=A0AAD5N6A6_PARTN|nr:hypothetical protein KIN20_023198 [Parelaphostrongylus tenuis]
MLDRPNQPPTTKFLDSVLVGPVPEGRHKFVFWRWVTTISMLIRTVKTDDVRVTSFPIKWDENQPDEYPPEPEQEEVDEANPHAC